MFLTQEYKAQWSVPSKIIFRFVVFYFGFYILFRFLGSSLFGDFFIWVGKNILKSEGRLAYFPTGSGDTTMAYISLFVQTALAVLGTVLWSILDRKQASYNKLFYWFLVLVRIFLIFFLLSYGFSKIFKTQFPEPFLNRLIQPIGEMSPMGLAWTYMGHSEGFNLVVGFFEALGGFLLIPRRTQTLGALVTSGVMFQVFLMNMFFDIPVKIFSFHLLIMALFIFSIDARRFINVFIHNKATRIHEFYNPIKDKLYHKIIFWFKVCATVILVGLMTYQGYERERGPYGDKRETPPFYGIWEVKIFTLNGDTIPPLISKDNRWRYLVIDKKNSAMIKHTNGTPEYLEFKVDSLEQNVTIKSYQWEKEESFSIHKQDSILMLDGSIYDNKIKAQFKAINLSKMELINRGFHWVNEYPYNR